MATVDTLVTEANKAYDDAKTLATNAQNAADRALNQASQAASGIVAYQVFEGQDPADIHANDIPEPALPVTDFSVDVRNAFNYAFGQLNDDIKPQITNYLEEFFPDIAECLATNSDEWICKTILEGRMIPAYVEDAVWNKARDREVEEGLRQERSAIEAHASRGFDTPQGTLNYTVMVNQQETAKRLTTINRELASKSFDVANDNVKFAIQQAVSLRTSFVNAMGDFIRLATAQPNNATEYARLILQAKTGLYDSAINLYRARISEEQLRTSVEQNNKELDLKSEQVFISSIQATNDAQARKAQIQANTALQAAENLARVASSAYATRNSMINVSAGV